MDPNYYMMAPFPNRYVTSSGKSASESQHDRITTEEHNFAWSARLRCFKSGTDNDGSYDVFLDMRSTYKNLFKISRVNIILDR